MYCASRTRRGDENAGRVGITDPHTGLESRALTPNRASAGECFRTIGLPEPDGCFGDI